jgi:ribosomal protein S18 acetylase RimI-like enzyme
MRIRPARADETEAISKLALRSKSHWPYSSKELDVFAGELTFSSEALSTGNAHVLEQDAHLLGFYTLLNLGSAQVELDHIFIDPDFLGRGFGRNLWRHACQLASSLGAKELLVKSDPHAAGFYLALGAEYSGDIASSIPGRMIPTFRCALNMTNAVSIRSFRAEDTDAVVQLWSTVFPDDPPWNAPELMIQQKLKVQPELLLVATTANTIVGAVIAGYDGVRGWIYHLAVAPECRRQGYATKLVRAAEDGLRKLGCKKINLQVRINNQEVVAFYRSLEYEFEERISMGRHV